MKLVKNIKRTESLQLAILCADIFEYSKHTNEDQEGTHKNLQDRFAIVEEIVKRNNGSIIRMHGDSLLITFEHVRNAIYCATEIQTSSHEHNFKIPLNNELLFRIGISYGEVICQEREPYGAPVNIAKRLEELARPGGIYLSDSAHSALEIAVPFPINYRGKIRVKNVDEPITVQEITQYEPLSKKKPTGSIFKHPIDRSYLGSLSILILAISVIVLAISVVVLMFALLAF